MTTHQPPSSAYETTKRSDIPEETFDVIAIAWPTGRPIRSYSVDELAEGVDLYTRAMKARAADVVERGDRDAR
ncbi:hypothetical protein EDC02_7712 [Micromonospora sp. Llam0]|uniref:hypothetical protein n=1 Tax=Micromonospora sp. Llam0 TaxID=2485143 RepID=UPI000F46A3D7|nr:hypothetical protein [Micromonospora sp. Llam0]ROO52771.1 hypothetical protein EDC02_7712 [Micromonospora sp. Llam0]